MAAPTAHTVGKRLLRYWGVTSLDSTSPSGQPFPIQSTDLDDLVGVMTGSLQELFDLGPAHMRQKSIGALLNAPTTVTLTATYGITTISALTTYAAWMLGCTIRITGDTQDNELSSSTVLARPYMGTSASGISATVYADSIQLDETVDRVLSPVSLPDRTPLLAAATRAQFIQLAGYPLLSAADGTPYGGPFNWFVRKTHATPVAWFVDGFYDSTKDYLPRRIRFAPMPDMAYPVGYLAVINPPRIATADIDNGDHSTDPGVKLPIPNGWIESIYMPICAQRMTATPKFHNDSALPEIGRQYKAAVGVLKSASRGMSALSEGFYV